MTTCLIVICGATATGKSGLAIDLAQRLNSMIISADSRQIYREFDIGTAKPSIAERNLIPHHLIDICDPTELLTLAQYQELAANLINNSFPSPPAPPACLNHLIMNQSPKLLVGGTGLYIKSIVKGLKIPRVSPHPELRSQLESLGQTQLYALLSQIDPIAAQKIHLNDPIRTIRALEVFYVTGIPISNQQGENPPQYPILQIGLDCDLDLLSDRIGQRTHKMLELGLVKEVEILTQKYGWNLPLLDTLGYSEIKQYLAGEKSLDEAIDLTVLHTRQFAKRQRTWFKAYPEIEWFDCNSSSLLDDVWCRVAEFTKSVAI
jgi:tRNA dimethylallyltransferase